MVTRLDACTYISAADQDKGARRVYAERKDKRIQSESIYNDECDHSVRCYPLLGENRDHVEVSVL